MSKPVDLAKLRTINAGGHYARDSRARVTRSDQGRITTIQIDHPDGSTEAIVRPGATRAGVSVSTGEVVANG